MHYMPLHAGQDANERCDSETAQHVVYHSSVQHASGDWNPDRLYQIREFRTYMYVLVCTEYVLVWNGTYMYVPICTQYVLE